MNENCTITLDPTLTLPEQVFEKIVFDIKNSKLLPGEKLPSDRALAKQYGIGRGSIIVALKRLEEECYVERIPARGSFVRHDAEITSTEINIAFISSEYSISIATMDPENWGINFEIFRGVNFAACKSTNVHITFRYMLESTDEMILRRQRELLKTFDGVIFVGHEFADLKNVVIRENIPAVIVAPDNTLHQELLPYVENDKEDAFKGFAEFLKRKKVNSIGLISEIFPDSNCSSAVYRDRKLKRLYKYIKDIEIIEFEIPVFVDDEDELIKAFEKTLPSKAESLPDVIYPLNALTIPTLYEFAHIKNWQIGKDIKIISFASGLSFNQLRPKMTFLQVPNCKMGEQAVEILIDAIRNKKHITNKLVQSAIVEGKSF